MTQPEPGSPLVIEIESVYDMLSHSRKGVITPQAPLMVSLHGLDVPEEKEVFLFLYPHGHNLKRIFIHTVYRFSPYKVIVMIPHIPPGVYHPGVMVGKQKGELPQVYELSSVSWTVKP